MAPSAHAGTAVLARFALLYVAIYAGFGLTSPFFPALLSSRGLSAAQLGLALALASAIRLIVAPVAARIADATGARRLVLTVSAGLAALATLGLAGVAAPAGLFGLTLLRAAALAPVTVLADALATAAAARARAPTFEYGWVRGAGSAAFVAGMLGAGAAVARAGLVVVVWAQAALLLAACGGAVLVPDATSAHVREASARRAAAVLWACVPFRMLLVAGALVLGSHAMHDTFAVIRWSKAGIGPRAASVLWSESVVAEVVVFLLLGPAILARVEASRAVALAAAAGVVRWAAMAVSANVLVLAAIEPLHGLTFALFHLAAMRLITSVVAEELQVTAIAIYGACSVGASTSALTWLSGELYARFGARGFWAMAALCVIALPLARGLRVRRGCGAAR